MLAKVALAAGKEAFSDYSHRYSPQIFTQPQLFACLVLKEFEKKDYRGIWQSYCQMSWMKPEPQAAILVPSLKIVPAITAGSKVLPLIFRQWF